MSYKRLLGITALGAAAIICVAAALYAISFFRSDTDEIELPDTRPAVTETSPDDAYDTLIRVEVTSDTVQDVIRWTLTRPEKYTRDITLESFWDGGSALYSITAAVSGGVTSLRVLSVSAGVEKRIIVDGPTEYIWYQGDTEPYIRTADSSVDGTNPSDEWQMILTYEDVLDLSKRDIIDAGYGEYGGEICIYVQFRSALLGYTTLCYISTELGLIVYAEEFDGETPVSRMTTGVCEIDEPDPGLFTLPDGTAVF